MVHAEVGGYKLHQQVLGPPSDPIRETRAFHTPLLIVPGRLYEPVSEVEDDALTFARKRTGPSFPSVQPPSSLDRGGNNGRFHLFISWMTLAIFVNSDLRIGTFVWIIAPAIGDASGGRMSGRTEEPNPTTDRAARGGIGLSLEGL